MTVVVIASDSETARRVWGLLSTDPAIHIEALLQTDPSFVLVSDVSDPGSTEWGRRLDTLSRREREVLQQLVDGHTIRSGAEHLFLSVNTFRSHVKSILAKLDAHSSLEAVSLAISGGMRPTRALGPGSDDPPPALP